jgi:sugar diacid utilization regulator
MLDLYRQVHAERGPTSVPGVEDGERLLVAPLAAGDEQLGILCCLVRGRAFGDEDADLLRAVANQTAVGLKKAELIERLTAENIVKDMFEALAAGSVATAEAKAVEARCDLSRPHVFLHIERAPGAASGQPWPELSARIETRLRRLYRRTLFDTRHDRVRALVPLPAGDRDGVEALTRTCDGLAREHDLLIGLTGPDEGATGARRRMREAADAARIARSLASGGGAISYDQLGAYRYLVHLELDDAPRDRYGRAVAALLEYDARRNAQLVETLETFLSSRSSVATSARALYIHPNTVRQRLDRIEQIAGLELRAADLLSLELALKVARLHRVRER